MSPATSTLDNLRSVLDHCARNVPLYRGIEPPREGEEELTALARFPLLCKERLRRGFPHDLVPAGRSLGEALRSGEITFVGTSGTSGERVQVLWHQLWWDAQELEGFRLHRSMEEQVFRPGFREAVLTTPVCSGNLCHVAALPMDERIENERTLFLNQTIDPSLWSDADVRRMADELDHFQPDALEADPAYLAHFAVRIVRLGRRVHQPAFIDVSYEFPSSRHLAAIARAFDAPIVDAYGSTECGFVLCACERGRIHHNRAWSHVELLPLARLDGVSRLVVTPLGNPWLNLVRFETGDLVRVADERCPCGREGLVLESIEGRAQDLVVDSSGGLQTVRSLDRALAQVAGLLHWRLVQNGPASYELDLLADGIDPLDPGAARDALAELLGAVPRTRVVASLPVEASGKYRLSRATHLDLAALVRLPR